MVTAWLWIGWSVKTTSNKGLIVFVLLKGTILLITCFAQKLDETETNLEIIRTSFCQSMLCSVGWRDQSKNPELWILCPTEWGLAGSTIAWLYLTPSVTAGLVHVSDRFVIWPCMMGHIISGHWGKIVFLIWQKISRIFLNLKMP